MLVLVRITEAVREALQGELFLSAHLSLEFGQNGIAPVGAI